MNRMTRNTLYHLRKMSKAFSNDLSIKIFNNYRKLLKSNDINICYNSRIPIDYDPEKENVLIAIESPEVILHRGWIRDDMKFVAEISFANFFNLPNYHCCRTLYATNDNFVEMAPESEFLKKELVSMIYSDKKLLKGHQFRHHIANRFRDQLDLYGSGTGKPLKQKSDSLDEYFFQVVIENGKYPEYVSEKFFDCLKRKTMPIYWGGEAAIKKMGFDPEGVLFFDDEAELEHILSNYMNEDYYRQKTDSLNNNLRRLIELRNEIKMSFFRNTIQCFYSHTVKSYAGSAINVRSFHLER